MLSFTCQVCVVGERIDGMAQLHVKLDGRTFDIRVLLHADLFNQLPHTLMLYCISDYVSTRGLSLMNNAGGFYTIYRKAERVGHMRVER